MIQLKHALLSSVLAIGASALPACKDKPAAGLAPSASALAPAMPIGAKARAFEVDPASSKVSFLMDAPLEKINGEAPESVSGTLFIDLEDIAKSTALVKIDLQKLSLYQQRRPDESGSFGERVKNDKQNTHARDWLQLVAHEGEVTAEQAEANRFAEFKLDKLDGASASNLGTLTGADRTITATARGDFRLHGRKLPKSAKLEITVHYTGDVPESVHVKTLEPVEIGLEEFEVNPRDGAGKFLKTVTEAVADTLKNKLAKAAPVQIEFTAKPK